MLVTLLIVPKDASKKILKCLFFPAPEFYTIQLVRNDFTNKEPNGWVYKESSLSIIKSQYPTSDLSC